MSDIEIGQDVMIRTIAEVKAIEEREHDTWYTVEIDGKLLKLRDTEIDA